jgi:hypothetical protein
MRPSIGAFVIGTALVTTGSAAFGHHAIAMFDQVHPIELVGTVQEFAFVNPHAFILLEVKGDDPHPVLWRLEGHSANSLAWAGWSSTTIKPGDRLRLLVEPLRSGAPGGAWKPDTMTFSDGARIGAGR